MIGMSTRPRACVADSAESIRLRGDLGGMGHHLPDTLAYGVLLAEEELLAVADAVGIESDVSIYDRAQSLAEAIDPRCRATVFGHWEPGEYRRSWVVGPPIIACGPSGLSVPVGPLERLHDFARQHWPVYRIGWVLSGSAAGEGPDYIEELEQ
jgi:hypothetical protein